MRGGSELRDLQAIYEALTNRKAVSHNVAYLRRRVGALRAGVATIALGDERLELLDKIAKLQHLSIDRVVSRAIDEYAVDLGLECDVARVHSMERKR